MTDNERSFWLWACYLIVYLSLVYCTAYLAASGWNHGLYASIDSIKKRRKADREKTRRATVFNYKPKGENE